MNERTPCCLSLCSRYTTGHPVIPVPELSTTRKVDTLKNNSFYKQCFSEFLHRVIFRSCIGCREGGLHQYTLTVRWYYLRLWVWDTRGPAPLTQTVTVAVALPSCPDRGSGSVVCVRWVRSHQHRHDSFGIFAMVCVLARFGRIIIIELKVFFFATFVSERGTEKQWCRRMF